MYINLFEFKCKDCKSVLLLEISKTPDMCPYCGGNIDYATGTIYPVLRYTPRVFKDKRLISIQEVKVISELD